MREGFNRILVTGGAGFIGSAVVRQLIAETDCFVTNVDKLTYAADPTRLAGVTDHPRHRFEQVDICDREQMERVFRESQPDAVINLAAETHVDRSIEDADPFVQTNVVGTHTLLEAARAYWDALPSEQQRGFRFLQGSTDEVFGDLGANDPGFREADPYAPSSPYAASKASSDHLVRAWGRTYGLPFLVTHGSNTYGPGQTRDKLVPLTINNALKRETIPLYGNGKNRRDWLFVEDHAQAIRAILTHGKGGRSYNIGGGEERTNEAVVRSICRVLDRERPDPCGKYERLIQYVPDRAGHDYRYALDCSRVREEVGWYPSVTFDEGIRKTVQSLVESG